MRLIDADNPKLRSVLYSYTRFSGIYEAPDEHADQELNLAPTVEGIEIRRRGTWIYGNGNGECPFCKRERQLGWDNFCGFCGAYMKGERKENEAD